MAARVSMSLERRSARPSAKLSLARWFQTGGDAFRENRGNFDRKLEMEECSWTTIQNSTPATTKSVRRRFRACAPPARPVQDKHGKNRRPRSEEFTVAGTSTGTGSRVSRDNRLNEQVSSSCSGAIRFPGRAAKVRKPPVCGKYPPQPAAECHSGSLRPVAVLSGPRRENPWSSPQSQTDAWLGRYLSSFFNSLSSSCARILRLTTLPSLSIRIIVGRVWIPNSLAKRLFNPPASNSWGQWGSFS